MKKINELSIPLAALIIATISVILASIANIASLDMSANHKACWIALLVFPFIIFLIIWQRKTTQTTPEFTPLAPRTNQLQSLDPEQREYFPYSVNRKKQVYRIQEIGFCKKKPLVWLIHGDRNQCHEKFLECVQWFHWETIKGVLKIPEPRIKFFPYPYHAENFENACMVAIWNNLSQNNQEECNWKNLSTLMNDNCQHGPFILYTKIRSDQWDQRIFLELLNVQTKMTGERNYPLILCVLIIYTKHHKRKIDRQLDLYKDSKLPMLSNVESGDVDEWQNMSFNVRNKRRCVKDIFRLEESEIDQIFKKGSLPMTELAKIFKHCLNHQDKGDDAQ